MEDDRELEGEELVEQDPVEALRARIAEKIREDSEVRGEVTSVTAIAPFFTGMTTGEVEAVMTGLSDDPQYQDLKAAAVGQAGYFFYSDRYLSAPNAEESALTEEAKARIVARVRHESATETRLTPVASLAALLADLEVDDLAPFVDRIAADERYGDVQVVSTADGARYLFSERHITRNYAALLARTAAGDPVATIAETVREDSQRYPRPTHISLFRGAPFHMDPEDVEAHVADLLIDEAYSDIRSYRATTGALYLYSEQHLTEALVRAQAEWEEVGKYENP